MNNHGDFTSENFPKGGIYDITIQDACRSVIVHQIKVGDLREVSLALVDKTPVCLGSPVQFRAMALPNPTFKWYKPGATDFWSEERAPVISSADWGDNGLHKVDITTSLCLTKTMTMELPVEIQEPPTLVRTGGEASQIICSGTGITDVVYTWGGSAQDVAVSGGLYSSYYVKDMTAKTLTIKGKFTNAVSYTITTVGGCEDISISGRFEMKQQPTGRILPENAVNQSICLGNPILPFTCYGLYTTTDMELTGLPDGLTIVHDQKNNQLKVSGTPTAVGVYTYTFTVRTSDPTNPCPENVYTGTITVATEDELELLSAAETEMQTLCYTSGGTITPIEYKWGGMATDVIVSGNMPESCYIKDMLNKTITINRVPISSGVITVTVSTNGGCNPKTMSFTVNVLTTPGYPILSFPSVCKGDDIFGTIIKSKQGYIYQRYDARTGGNPVGAPITGNGSDIKMNCGKMGDEENTIVYLDVTSNEGCSLTERMMIYVNRIKAFEVYPDLRIKTSCNEKPINLTKYINPEWFISIKWTPESSFEDGGDNNGVLKPDVVLDKGNTYVYNFSVTNECVTAGGKLYLSVTEPENVQSAKEVKICYENATSIYLNPIMGIEAEGEWKCIPEDANYYLDVSDYPPFENMAILNGENIWYDGGIPFIGDTKRVDVVFTPSKSCFNNAEYKLTIILTSDLSS